MILKQPWFRYALVTTLFWGVWGAFIEIPEKAGFPATLGYVAWAISMIPCALVALYGIRWKLETDLRSVGLGMLVGLLGAGGQLILFLALREGPAYIVFPFISLFPIVTILLSTLLLRERGNTRQWAGIAIALVAIFFLSYSPQATGTASGTRWIWLALIVFIMWGVQAYAMKFSNATMQSESIFFYMTISALVLVPLAIGMTDLTQPIFWGWKGPYLAGGVHVLNSIGALTLVYALRYGKAIIVVPLTGLSPILTVILSLIVYSVIPGPSLLFGIVLALVAIYLLSE
ncbi:DMT family transporter [Parachryseolinea silvisoli]|uniref:DMT family transporter n=1 Tax=Parachryseolinea silvisoli TaxID=2873601 RepID=UPI002265A880|nr:DMT family transporter [Parachryseolinea silvisoli]